MEQKALPADVFSALLLQWYERRKRDLPWRATVDPYRTWVSEVMLQQTRVDTVIPYFERFVETFPTVSELAAADSDDVLKRWEGLGYYSRARRLHQGAREVVARYGGNVPGSLDEFRSLPGVGEYTAGAVLSIAFGEPVPAVDGNVARVFARLLNLDGDIAKPNVRQQISAEVALRMPRDRAADFNQGLMELGALVCVPKNPKCSECPVRSLCAAKANGVEHVLPRRAKKLRPPTERHAAYMLFCGERVCVRRRPLTGLLAGLWELPNHPLPGVRSSPAAEEMLASWDELLYSRPNRLAYIGDYKHQFSHLHWVMSLYAGRVEETRDTKGCLLVDREELGRLAFGRVFLTMLDEGLRLLQRGEATFGVDVGHSNQ